MNVLLCSLSDSLNNPSRLHAAIVHMPIAIALLGFVLVVALALTRGRSSTLRTIALVLYLLGAVSGFMAGRSGEAAEDFSTQRTTLSAEADATLEKHEDMGKKAWLFLAGSMLAVGLTAINRPVLRGTFVVIALVVSLSAAGWVTLTGHLGGELVYEHGIGVPASTNNIPATTQPAS